MDDRQNQRAGAPAAEGPGSDVELREMVVQMAGLLTRIDKRFGLLEEQVKGMSAQLHQLGERMEDLEDRDRYARHAGRFLGASPRTVEQYRTSAGSINAGHRDVDIFPSLSQ